MSRNNSPARRKTRREQADNCARRNEVIEAEDAWDLLMAVIQAVADTPWKPLADGEVQR